MNDDSQSIDEDSKVIKTTQVMFDPHSPLIAICPAVQERHLSKISTSMLEGTAFTTLAEGLQIGAELVGMAVPGFILVFAAFKAVHTLASSFATCSEESARLMSYCNAMATALSRLQGKVTETEELTAALKESAAALQQLRDLIVAQMGQSTLAKIFTSPSYKSASEKAAQDVERAVRRAMDEAQLQGLQDAAKTRGDVDLLLKRRCEPPLTRAAADSSDTGRRGFS